ncbi:hypothetical protein HY256_07395 [Candidatus Sumerlaeota bacterium]|nr:hypothetical protein [Candidatus Sumerlaeota bacterium]
MDSVPLDALRIAKTRFDKWFDRTIVTVLVAMFVPFAVLVGYALFHIVFLKPHRDVLKCQENLTKIVGAKEQWAFENGKPAGTPVTEGDFFPANHPYDAMPMPNCPSGATYIINPIGADPVCTSGLPGHSLKEVGLAITELER